MDDGRNCAPPRVTVRSLDGRDLAFAAALHREALPHGFFAALGTNYLRAYYRCFMTSPSGVALLAEAGSTPLGVVVGVTDGPAHQAHAIRACGPGLALRGCLGLLRQPRLAVGFVRSRLPRYVTAVARALARGRRPVVPAGDEERVGALVHLAVVAGNRGKGVGTLLTDRLVEEVRRAGTMRLELVTLRGGTGAREFYDRLGWREVTGARDEAEGLVRFALELE